MREIVYYCDECHIYIERGCVWDTIEDHDLDGFDLDGADFCSESCAADYREREEDKKSG